jgi:hypothetical protein
MPNPAPIGPVIAAARERASRPPLPAGRGGAPEPKPAPKARRLEGYEKMPRDCISLND